MTPPVAPISAKLQCRAAGRALAGLEGGLNHVSFAAFDTLITGQNIECVILSGPTRAIDAFPPIGLLFLIPQCGILQSERELTLPMMRAVHIVTMLMALVLGLPGLAHAHAGHGTHDQMIGHDVTAIQSRGADYAAVVTDLPETAHQLAPTSSEPLFISTSARDARPSSSRHAVSFVQGTTFQSCTGGCCCPGMSACGMGACCHASLTAEASAFDFPRARAHVSPRLYGRAALTLILGLDRPPKV